MTKRTRRILFWLAVAVFLASAPLIVSYARGYRFDLTQFVFSRVGAIALETKPKDAAVWLNERKLAKSTPVIVRNLFSARTYKVRVVKEGFWPWEKELVVEPEKITAARKVILFPRELTLEAQETEDIKIDAFFLSANAENALILRQNNIELFITSSNEKRRVNFGDNFTTRGVKNVQWLENGSGVIFSRLTRRGENWYLLQVTSGTLANLSNLYERRLTVKQPAAKPFPRTFSARQVIFADAAGRNLIALIEGKLIAINLENEMLTDLLIEDVEAIDGRSEQIVIFKKPDIFLTAKRTGEAINLYGNLRFVPQRLLLSPDGKKVAYWHNFAVGVIWLEELSDGPFRKQGEQEVVLQPLAPLKHLRWHASSEYLLAHLENGEFSVAELDGRGGDHNTWTWNLPEARSFDYTPAKEELWILNQDGVLLRHSEKF